MFEKNTISTPEKPKEAEKEESKRKIKKVIAGGVAAGLIAGAAEQALAARDTVSESQDRKATEYKMQNNYGQKEQRKIEDKLEGKIVTAQAEKQEQLQLFVSGTIDGKTKFEIYKTNFNAENDKEFIQTKKNALEAYNKSNSMEELKKYRMLDKEVKNKEFKIYIGGKEARITDTELYMDGGSRGFDTDMGSFFIAHPMASERYGNNLDKIRKVESRFSTPDGKQHLIQVQGR